MEQNAATPLSPRKPQARVDLWIVVAVTLATFLIGSTLEFQESLTSRLARLEKWQLDELPLSLTVLAGGLAWYAVRRRREVEQQLALRVQAEARIADLLVHNRELARQLISLQETERLAIARELHDELGQNCAAIRVETAFMRNTAPGDRDAMLAAVTRTDAAASDLYRLLSNLLRRLRPANLDTLGLVAAIEELCDAWMQRTGTRCTVDAVEPAEPFGNDIDIAIYRVVQEALTNAARHAAATHVRVTLTVDDEHGIAFGVHDDGRGMDLAVAPRGLGLLGAVERIAAVDGTLSLSSEPGAGFRLDARIPWRATGRPPSRSDGERRVAGIAS